jgi:hypothetical protein
VSAAGYIAAGYAATAVVVGGYVAFMFRRARMAARAVPPNERPWVRATTHK